MIENNALKCLVAAIIKVTGSVPCELNRPNIWLTLNSLPANITFKISSISASLEFGEQLIISWGVIGVSSLSLYSANLAIVCLKSPGCKSDANVASWAKPSCEMFCRPDSAIISCTSILVIGLS